MEKEEKILESAKRGGSKGIEGDINVLKQLVASLEDSEKKLEEFYKKDDPENLNKVKKFMINLSEKISEVMK